MIHLYLSLPSSAVEGHDLVEEIISLNAGIGLVQAAAGDDEITRQVAAAHISACEGLLAVITGTPTENQTWEISSANEAEIPVLLLADEATVDMVEGRPVRTFATETFLEFVDALTPWK